MNVHSSLKRFFQLLTMLLVIFCSFDAFAELQMINPKIGFGGKYHAGTWTPVTVTLDNNEGDVSDFEGRIEVEVSGVERRYLYSQDVILPKGSIKQYQLYAKFPQNNSDRPKITVYTKRGLKATPTLVMDDKAMEPEVPLVVLAMERGSGRPPTRFDSRPYITTYISPEDLPEHWYGYQGVTQLVIPKLERNGFSQQQEDAIIKWVESGGKVLVLGGKDSVTYANSFIEKEFGLKFGKTHLMEMPKYPKHMQTRAALRPTKKLSAEQNQKLQDSYKAPVATITTEKNARVLLQDGPLKLAVRLQRGQGYIDAWGWNFDNQKVNNTPLVKMLWDSQIGDHTPSYESHVFGEYMYNKFNRPFKDGEGQNVPNILAILLILIIYFVCVAGNFRYLARIKRLELAWLTLPVIIFGFSTGIYGIGIFTKSDALTLRHYNIINCKLNQTTGNLNSISMLWSPTKRSYQLNPTTDNGTVIDHRFWHDGEFTVLSAIVDPLASVTGAVGQKTKTKFSQTSKNMVISTKEMRHGVWSMLNVQDVFALEGEFEGDLKWRLSKDKNNNEVKGKLVNNTAHKFDDVFLVMHRIGKNGSPSLQAVRLDSWKPGDDLEIEPLLYTSEFKSLGFVQLDSLELLRGEDKESEKSFRANVAKALISSRFENLRIPQNSAIFREQASAAWLVGWSADIEGPVKLIPKPQKEDSYTLFCIDISPDHNGRYQYNKQAMRPQILVTDARNTNRPFDNDKFFRLHQAAELDISMKIPNQAAPLKSGDLTIRYVFKDMMTNRDYVNLIQTLNHPTNSGSKAHRAAVVDFYEKMKTAKVGALDMSIYNYCDQNFYNVCKWVTKTSGSGSEAVKNNTLKITAEEALEFVNPYSGEIILRAKNKHAGWGSSSEFSDLEIITETIPTEVEL